MARGVHRTPHPDATAAIARGLASVLRGGDAVELRGELGAGKTTFVRALAGAAGIDDRIVASPTFVLVHVYPAPDGGPLAPLRGVRLVHVDAYRLAGADDLDALGWDQWFEATGAVRDDAVALIEWPERLPLRPAGAAVVRIEHAPRDGAETRLLAIELPDAWLARPGVKDLLERPPAVCPTTRVWVAPTEPTYPFASARARDADLYGWLTEKHTLPRPAKPEDEAAE